MTHTSWTPGRVNLIGEWIDFNGGWVLPAAIPLGVGISTSPIDGDQDEVRSAQFDGLCTANLNQSACGHWADYVLGGLQAARREGWLQGAASVTLDSSIPPGAGVSSSAAVVVGALKALAPDSVSASDIAQLAKRVENEYIGVPCGIMDQMAVAHSSPGEALALNTRDLQFRRLSIPANWNFVVLHSGVERQLADGRYKERRDACLEAAELLNQTYLCDANDLSSLPARLNGIARHAVDENKRTQSAISAMQSKDAKRFGDLMVQSHASLRDDFHVSHPDVDALVADAVSLGAEGARITGAGFGGCVVALVSGVDVENWSEALLKRHPKARLVCKLSASSEQTP